MTWQQMATDEANRQGVPIPIVLATIEAETNGRNVSGDSGNAVGYGQVWAKWHMDSFIVAAKIHNLEIPANIPDLIQFTLANDAFSLSMSVDCIGNYWRTKGGDWDKFTRSYVGPGIPDSDYKRRLAIWNKYNNSNFDYTNQPQILNQPPSSSSSDGIIMPETIYQTIAGSQKSGDILYGRRYRVLVSTKDDIALEVSDLKCTFSVNKTMAIQPNYSEVIIYNLNVETENAIINEGNRIIIEAGYEGSQYGLIFDGNVILPIREKENGTDYKLTLESMDGDRFAAYSILNASLPKGQNPRSIIAVCSSQANIPSELGSISEGLSQSKLTRGKVMFGSANSYLRQISQSENAVYYLEDGKVNIIQAQDLPEDEIIELSPESGLLGTPAQTEYGVTAKCLLNPRIKLNTLVHIDNSLIRANQVTIGQYQTPFDKDGIYKVIQLNHVGDTYGEDWYTEIETVTQVGKLPSMLLNANANLW